MADLQLRQSHLFPRMAVLSHAERSRRQTLRAAISAALAPVALLFLAGCAAPDYSDVDAAGTVVAIDAKSQTIDWPLNEFGLMVQDGRTVEHALDLLHSDCAADQGLEIAFPDRRRLGDEDSEDRTFGVWNAQWAARYGFGSPPDSDLKSELLAVGEGFTEAEYQIFLDCVDQVAAEHPELDIEDRESPSDPAYIGRVLSLETARARNDYQAVVAEWQQCVESVGLTVRKDEPLTISKGALGTEEQLITAAVADVNCKDQTELVQRLANIVGAVQIAYIDDNRAALDAQSAQNRAAVEAANVVIAGHGG